MSEAFWERTAFEFGFFFGLAAGVGMSLLVWWLYWRMDR